MKNEPVFLTDKNHNIVLEALSPAPNAALPDSCKPFEILEPTTAEGAAEKHLPVVEQNGLRVTVRVGSIFHPMDQEHSIGWVCLVTKAGCIMRVPLTLIASRWHPSPWRRGMLLLRLTLTAISMGCGKNQSDFDRLCFPGKVPETSGQK